MKLKMKRAISFIALVVMMVSLFSVCVFPAAAEVDAVEDTYGTLLNSALIVDPDWAGKTDGEVSYTFRGESKTEKFDADWHFASVADAWAYAQKKGISNPTILLNAGVYTETIEIKGAVTLLGAAAGMDPNVKSANKKAVWALSADRSFTDDTKETIIKGNVIIRLATGEESVVLDGFAFADGGALVDNERDLYASETTIKNTIFKNAGNATTGYYALYLRSPGHERTLNLENLYITAQSYDSVANPNSDGYGFISPYFVELNAKGVAFIENKAGFIAKSWFTEGVSPYIDIADSCFYNASAATPIGYVISVRNAYSKYDYAKDTDAVISKDSAKRPAAALKLTNNIFYNASASTGDVIHYQFTGNTTTLDVQGNYFYQKDGSAFVNSEFLINSDASDLTSCMVVRNNWLIGAYKVPSLLGSSADTYIDMSLNYFARTNGEAVNFPVYSTKKARRLIRTEFWADEAMTIKNTHWNILAENWGLVWVDNNKYNVELYMYTENDEAAALPVTFRAQDSALTVEMFKSATLDADGIPTKVSDPITKIDQSVLNNNIYEPTVLYLKVTDPANSSFTPIYTITVSNCGDTKNMQSFSEAFPGYYFVHSSASKLNAGDEMPYRWHGSIYTFVVGKNLFATAEEAMKQGYKDGYTIPTICLPAGIYERELTLLGSCTILGEKYGINPNTKPYEYLTYDKFPSSPWTLSPDRSIESEETIFYAPIRVDASADDYIITVDGITMKEGCSYIDDSARSADNVTILKNIFALDAVGGTDRNGAPNTYLFNFNKAYGPLTDRCTLYMYDCRVDGLDGEWLFGPYYEKFVVDGLYYAHGKNGSWFMNNMQSRDIANPYYSMTNGYYYRNDEGQSGIYTWTTRDDQGSQAVKENIIYNIDGNVFNYAFQVGYAPMQYWWSGTNMSVQFTNNIMYNGNNSFIAQTTGGIRYKGNCSESDCSDILIMKGNRFIETNRVPLTNGCGPGTNFDWSGNFWSNSLSSTGLAPANMKMQQPNESSGSFTYEECIRWSMEYSYLDWDMTIRSDEVLNDVATLEFSKGPYGTGTVREDDMMVYSDTVKSDVSAYESPALVGEFNTVKYFSDANCTNEISALKVSGAKNVFYGVVYPYGVTTVGANTIKFKVEINREVGSEANLLSYSEGLIDVQTHTVIVETSVARYNLSSVDLVLSDGATAGFYSDANATVASATNIRFGSDTEKTIYLKVTSEDKNENTIYTVLLKKSDVGTYAGLVAIDDMKLVGQNAYAANVYGNETTVNFTPAVYHNSTLVVTYGDSVLRPNGGVYSFEMEGDSATVTIVATAETGSDTRTYTLSFERTVNPEIKIFGIENAAPRSNGFSMVLYGSAVVEGIKANISAGATYGVYKDYACKTPVQFPMIIEGESEVCYVKATSADGGLSKVVRLTIHTTDSNRVRPVIRGEVSNTKIEAVSAGETDYNLYLDANTTKVLLSGAYEFEGVDADGNPAIVGPTAGGAIKFFADPQMKIEIDAKSAIVLNQKLTKVYYTISEGTYNLTVQDNPDSKPHTIEANFAEKKGVITIISDRKSVAYSDAAKIPGWAADYVDYLNEGKYGIFMGDAAKQLNPNDKITRAEIATVAVRVLGLDVKKYAKAEVSFADKVDSWALPYARAAVATGIIEGALDAKTGKIYFKGNDYATREQVMKIFVSACLVNEGITEDGATYYKNNKNNIDLVYNTYAFADEAKVSSWATPYVHLAVGKYQLIGGAMVNGKLCINPQAKITRAEVIKMVGSYMAY